MKTLDRYVVRTFLTSVFLVFVGFLLLRVMVDTFVNIDEYAEAGQFKKIVVAVLDYYGYQVFAYLLQLGGIIIVFAAVVTIWYMNHTNELTAILAAGISLHRVVLPIILLALGLQCLLVIDQEVIVPRIAHKLIRQRDSTGHHTGESREFAVKLLCDGNRTAWYSERFDDREDKLHQPAYMVRHRKEMVLLGGGIARGEASVADPEIYGTPGWVLTDASLRRMDLRVPSFEVIPDTTRVHSLVSGEDIFFATLKAGGLDPEADDVSDIYSADNPASMDDDRYGLTISAKSLEIDRVGNADPVYRLIEPAFRFTVQTEADGERLLGTFHADSATWGVLPDSRLKGWVLTNGRLFYATDLSPEELFMQQSGQWVTYMSSRQLDTFLKSGKASNPAEVELTKYVRLTDPINNMIMLLLGLPFILSRERDLKASILMCFLVVGAFFGFVYISRFLSLPPFWGAFLPVLLFGPIAAAMLDSVKT